MNYPASCLAALIVAIPAASYATQLPTTVFKDSADFSNLVRSDTAATATISVVNAPVSTLTGDAVRVLDTSTTRLPQIAHQTSVALADAVKFSFDVKINSISSPIVVRLGPTASALGTLNTSTFGIQLTSSGSVTAEQGVTVGSGTNANVSYASSYSTVNPFNVTIFYNNSASAVDLTAYSGPANLASKRLALYVDGTLKSSTLAERYSQNHSTGFGFVWRSGTGASANAMDFQLDNIEYTNISAIPEPSSAAALFGFGALGFVASGRRRRRALTS
jgi:hypothetical protein